MERQGSFVNVKTRDGRVLLSLFPGKGIVLEGKLDTVFRQKDEPKEKKGDNGGNGGNGGHSTGNELMTYPQKRFLFRILAQQGVEGDAAQAELLKLFQVDELKDVTKSEAIRMIERLLKEAKEGGGGNGIPF